MNINPDDDWGTRQHNYCENVMQMLSGKITLLQMADNCDRFGETYKKIGWCETAIKLRQMAHEQRKEGENEHRAGEEGVGVATEDAGLPPAWF
jgi:hypothetical protein